MFSENERAIFQVEISEQDVRNYDPLDVQDKLLVSCKMGLNRALKKRWDANVAIEKGIVGPKGDAIQLTEEAKANAEREIGEAELALVEAGRSAFGFEPVNQADGSGIPSAVVLSVVDAFVEWRNQKKSSSEG